MILVNFQMLIALGLKAVKSEAQATRQHYAHTVGKATAPPSEERSALFFFRCLALVFKRRKPRQELKEMCVALGVTFLELVNDMPIRWNSTHKLCSAAVRMERPLRLVLQEQTWDPSVKEHLTPTDTD